MFKHYLKTAWRSLLKQKWFSVINLLCLAIGITFSMLIGVYILNQVSVNKSLKDIDRQYFLKTAWKEKDMGSDITTISPLAKALKDEYPNIVENYYRYDPVSNIVSAGEKHFKEDIAIGDTSLVSMYGFPLLYGNKNHAFKDNTSAVITETFAMKLFGTKNAVGKRLSIQSLVAGVSQDYIVSSILKDVPYNSVTHLLNDEYSVFVPTTDNHYFQMADPSLGWDNANELSFIKLKPGMKPADLVIPINRLLHKYSSNFIWKNLSEYATPLKDYYLKDNNYAVQKMIRNLSLIVAFILLMVIINFVNINIGTSSHRIKEIGLRKTFGSSNKKIALQFLTETFLLTLVAAFISLFLYQLLCPIFSNTLNISYPAVWQFSFKKFLLLFLLVLFIGLLAGIYPAFVLSATDLVLAVKGKINAKRGSVTLRKSLLVVQFSVAIFVFIFALIVSRQVSYIFNKNLGYNKDQLLVITAFPKQWDSAGVAKMESVKQNLLQSSSVKSATVAFDIPESEPYGRIILYTPNTSSSEKSLNLPVSCADEDYVKTFEIPMLAGSFFSKNKNGIVLNETAVKSLGLTSDNYMIKTYSSYLVLHGRKIIIFHYTQNSYGITFCCSFNLFSNSIMATQFRFLIVKLNGRDIAASLNDVKTRWKAFLPNAPFDFTFMDNKLKAIYKSELQLKSAANIATALNLVIVFLGIVGVIAFTLVKRTKEIAIRKVLGATPFNILILFLKDYALLLLIANIIAWTFIYGASNYWLQQYAYNTGQNIVPYLMACIIVFFITGLLIIIQSYKAAKANPVKSLKTE